MKNFKDIILEKLKVSKHELPELDIDDTDTEMLKDRFHPFRVECEFQQK